MSKQIAPYARSILGVDVSQEMVDLYNETGEKEGFSGMKAVCAELKGEVGELDGQKFDVIVVSIAPSEWKSFPAESHPLSTVYHGISPFRRCRKDVEDPCWIPKVRRKAHR